MKSAPCQKPVLPANPSSPLSFRHDPQPHCIYDTITHTAYNDAAEPSARGNRPCQHLDPDRQILQSFIITALPAFFLPCCDHTGSVHNETSRLQAKGSGLRFKAQQRKRKSERKNKVTTKQLEKRCICTELYYLVCIHYTRTCTRTHSTHAHIRTHTNIAIRQSRLSSRSLASSLYGPGLSISLHPLQIILEFVLAVHVSHNVIERNDGYDGHAEFLFDLLHGRELAVLTAFLSVDELQDPDQLGFRVVGEDGDGFPDSFL